MVVKESKRRYSKNMKSVKTVQDILHLWETSAGSWTFIIQHQTALGSMFTDVASRPFKRWGATGSDGGEMGKAELVRHRRNISIQMFQQNSLVI